MNDRPFLGERKSTARWAWSLAALLGVLVVVLAIEVRALRPLRGELQRQRLFPHVGQWLPSTRVATVHGDSVQLAEAAPGRA